MSSQATRVMLVEHDCQVSSDQAIDMVVNKPGICHSLPCELPASSVTDDQNRQLQQEERGSLAASEFVQYATRARWQICRLMYKKWRISRNNHAKPIVYLKSNCSDLSSNMQQQCSQRKSTQDSRNKQF